MEVKFKFSKDLVKFYEVYDKLRNLTDGDVSKVREYLIPYTTESDIKGTANFANRARRLYYVNFCEPYLMLHQGHLTQEITVKGIENNDKLKEIFSDVTGYGIDQKQMIADLVWDYMEQGLCGVLVDRTEAPGATLAEARASGERSYQILYASKDIYYYSYFEDGAKKGQLKELILAGGIKTVNGKEAVTAKRYYFEGEELNYRVQELYFEGDKLPDISKEVVFQAVSEGEQGALERIPFVIFGKSAEESFLYGYYNLNVAHMNLKSVLSNINYNQGFKRSFAVGAKEEEVQNVGEYILTILSNPDAKVFDIPAGDPTAIESEIAKLERQIDLRAQFKYNQLSDEAKNIQSAESKAKDMVARVGIYDGVLNKLEKVLEQIYSLHAEYEGISAEITVTIGREYNLEDEQADMQMLSLAFSQAREVGANDVQKDILKAIVLKLKLPLRDEDNGDRSVQIKRLFDSIDAASNATPLSSLSRPSVGSLFP